MPTSVVAYVLGGLLLVAGVSAPEPEINRNAAALKEFGDRTKAYMELHREVAATVPGVSDDTTPEAIELHRNALAAGIKARRRGAREGDIFTRSVAPQFRQIIRRDLQSRDVRDALATMEEVPRALVVRISERWPAEVPRGIVPPRLLNNLYPLPEGLEYRLFDRHLVLMDVDAQLVVDIVRDVVPSTIRRRR